MQTLFMLLSFMVDQVSSSRLQIFTLGHTQIKLDGQLVNVGERKAIALLAYLAVSGARHSRDALSTLLWPEQSQAKARAALRHALWSLKAGGLDVYIDKRQEEIGFLSNYWLDVIEFNTRIAEYRKHGHAPGEGCSVCLASLEKAIALYQDDFFAGFTLRDSPQFDEWQYFQMENWKQLFTYALECLARWYARIGEWEQAIEYARRWVALDPLHEPARRWLMCSYAWSGKRSLAIKQYEALKRMLSEELGTVPEKGTSDLADAIRSNRPVDNAWVLSAGEGNSCAPASLQYRSAIEAGDEQTKEVLQKMGMDVSIHAPHFPKVKPGHLPLTFWNEQLTSKGYPNCY